ncbi:MAG: SIMPL domain-containing protein [Microbacteriaceae bacterium]
MTTIIVAGVSERTVQPEIVTIDLNLQQEGESRENCVREVTELHQRTVALLKERKTAGAIAEFSAGHIRSGSYQRWVSGDQPNVLTQYARSSITITYQNFETLAQDAVTFSENPLVQLQNFRWDVRKESRKALSAELRTEAVADAAERAALYASAAGIRVDSVHQISEPGLAPSNGNQPRPEMLRASADMQMKSGSSNGDSFDVVPPELTLEASIVVEYSASAMQ